MSEVIPEGWGQKKLGEVATLTMGQSPSSHTYNFAGKGLPFFQGKADFSAREAVIRSWCSEPTKTAPAGSILFSVRAPVGETNIAPKECCIGRGLAAIIAKKTDQEFLFQYLLYSKPQFEAVSQGSTFEAINGNELKEFMLLHPPLPEQQKIATILSSVDDVIEKTRTQIDKLKDLKTGMMQELLTQGIGHTEFKDSPVGRVPQSWNVKPIGSLFFVQLGKMLSKAAKQGNAAYPYLGNKNVQWGKVDISELETMDFSSAEREKFSLIDGDLLICEGGDVGRAAIWRSELKNCYFQKAIHRLRPKAGAYNPTLLMEYLAFAKKTGRLMDYISQTSIAHLTKEKLESVPIPVPGQEEQRHICQISEGIDQNISKGMQRLHALLAIKKALMQDLLTGKVRVKLDSPEVAAA